MVFGVAPLAGAWIETALFLAFIVFFHVAPLAGAWIETLSGFVLVASFACRAPRGRVD